MRAVLLSFGAVASVALALAGTAPVSVVGTFRPEEDRDVEGARREPHSMEELRRENEALARLNERLRAIIREKKRQGGTVALQGVLSPAEIALIETASSASVETSTDEAPCVEVDDEPGVDQATSNFCLAPAECQERMFNCRRHCVQKCWQTDYAKGGAAPGAGDLDQDRLEQINNRVEQKLKEIGIDLGCTPCTGESTVVGKGTGGGKDNHGDSGSERHSESASESGSKSSIAPTEIKHRFASLRANGKALEETLADEEGVVQLE